EQPLAGLLRLVEQCERAHRLLGVDHMDEGEGGPVTTRVPHRPREGGVRGGGTVDADDIAGGHSPRVPSGSRGGPGPRSRGGLDTPLRGYSTSGEVGFAATRPAGRWALG